MFKLIMIFQAQNLGKLEIFCTDNLLFNSDLYVLRVQLNEVGILYFYWIMQLC